jgi:lipopolysaccharide/colanic/teichoic acid biosynthesis glycosyltransferase
MTGTHYPSEKIYRVDSTADKDRPKIRIFSNFIKRFFDICISFLGLVVLSPFFILIGYLIRRDSPGPVFFRCYRMGKDQRPFQMLKFRTMYEDPKSYDGPSITCEGDERITPYGRWLRDTKVNELPQLWNVLKGEMSLVGPRPEDVDIAKNWSEEDRRLIFSVFPGITSPASILYRDEEQLLSKGNLMQDYLEHILPDKMRFDRLYVQNRSFTSDLDILFWTLVIIIPNIVKSKIPVGYLFAGPISRVMNRFVTWFLTDFCVSFIVVGGVTFFWRLQAPLHWGAGNLSILAFMIAVIFSGFNYILGLNKIIWQGADLIDAIRLSLSCWVVFVLLLVLNSLQSTFKFITLPALPTSMLIITGLFAQIGFISVRYHWRLVATIAGSWLALRRNRMEIGERALIVGARDGFITANWLLRRSELSEFQNIFHIVGVVDDKILAKQGMILNGCSVLGQVSDLPKIVEKQKISVIVFTTMNVPKEIKEYVAELKLKSFVKIVFLDNVAKMINQELTSPGSFAMVRRLP